MRKIYEWMSERDPLDWTLVLTLVLILVSPGPTAPGYLVIPATILAICGLFSRELRHDRRYWFVFGAFLIFVHAFWHYYTSDNHKFLIALWTFSLGFSLSTTSPTTAVGWTGRNLVGLVFLLAVVQKVTTWDYLNGTMFEFLLMTDFRFQSLAQHLGGFPAESYLSNQQLLSNIRVDQSVLQLVGGGGQLAALAQFLTWWTLLIETSIVVLFLVPRSWAVRWRHPLLLAFIITTYPPTNVIQFGWIIIIMAAAGLTADQKRLRFAYLMTFLFIFCFSRGFPL